MPDINFDPLIERFQKNIYGSTKGYIRQYIVTEQLAHLLKKMDAEPLKCADIGGGLGQISGQLASDGHAVDYFDISRLMREHAEQNLTHARRVRFFDGPFQKTLHEKYQLIVCQALLEWLEQPFEGLKKLCAHIEDDGYLFLLFYNKAAIVVRNLIRGNVNAALGDSRGDGHTLTPINPLDAPTVLNAITQNGLSIEYWFGVRCFTDFQARDTQARLGRQALLEAELSLSQQDPYRHIARYIGVVAKK